MKVRPLVLLLLLLLGLVPARGLDVYNDGLWEKLEAAAWTLPEAQSEESAELNGVLQRHRQAALSRPADEISALLIKGRYESGGESYPFTVRKMRPHFFRLDLTSADGAMVQAFDGARGWITPMGADRATGSYWMDRAENAAMARDAVMLNYLIEADREDVQLRMLKPRPGAAELGVQVEFPNGGLVQYWLDPTTYLIVREVKADLDQGAVRFRTSQLSDYRDVDGVKLAHRVDHLVSGEPESTLIIDEIQLVDAHSPLIFAAPILDEALSAKPAIGQEPSAEPITE